MAPRPNVEEERKAQIVEAALRCFARDGFDKASMDVIAAEAGLSKALLYYYYKNKDDVFESAFDAWMTAMTESSEDILSPDRPRESLLQFAAMLASLGEGAEDMLSLLLTYWAMAKRREFLLERFRTAMRSIRAKLVEVLDAGVEKGELVPMNTSLGAIALFAALDGLWAHWLLDPEDIDLNGAAREIVTLFLRSVGTENS